MIEDFGIGQVVTDLDGAECVIMDMTSNSICVHIKKKRKEGIDCNQWFTIENFVKRFKN